MSYDICMQRAHQKNKSKSKSQRMLVQFQAPARFKRTHLSNEVKLSHGVDSTAGSRWKNRDHTKFATKELQRCAPSGAHFEVQCNTCLALVSFMTHWKRNLTIFKWKHPLSIVFIGRLHFLNFERMNKLIDGAYGHPCQMHKRTWND